MRLEMFLIDLCYNNYKWMENGIMCNAMREMIFIFVYFELNVNEKALMDIYVWWWGSWSDNCSS